MRAVIAAPADVGRLVQSIRRSRGMTQRELATALGVSHRWLAELELGRGKQANERYFAVLRKLGIVLTAEVADG